MQPVSRRTVVAGLVATAATHHRQTTDARSQTLWELARSKGLLFGAAVLKRHLDDDPRYASAVAQNCNVLVAEGEMKWGAVEWQRGTLDFSAGDAIAAFARLHGQKLRVVFISVIHHCGLLLLNAARTKYSARSPRSWAGATPRITLGTETCTKVGSLQPNPVFCPRPNLSSCHA